MKDLIYKYVLQNAAKYDGKANAGSIIGKVIGDKPELKNDMKSLGREIAEAVKKVNVMKLSDQIAELQKIAPELLEEKKIVEDKRLPPLVNVKGKVVMRLAPNPNGPLHIGHARMIILNDEYTKMYNGELILRFDDTDPKNDNKKPMKEAYAWAEEDLKWMNVKYDRIERASSRLDKYYKFFEELIGKDVAYVCTCEQEAWSELVRTKRKACPCRSLSISDNLKRWHDMLSGKYKEGEVVGRLKTSIYEDDPALVDWPTFRLVDNPEHPFETRAKVWPMLDFASAYDDHDFGITHILRGKDLVSSEFKQKILYNYLNWKYPETMIYGKFVTKEDMVISKSKINEGMKSGKYIGYDDPRLAVLRAFKRRGIQAKAIRNYMLALGVSQSETTVDLDILFNENRKLIENEANRYFLVEDPMLIDIIGMKGAEIKLKLHPQIPEKGFRKYIAGSKYYITKTDFENLGDGKVHRLMDCCNFTKKGKEFVFHSFDYESFRDSSNKGMIIHYVPFENTVKFEVLMDNGTKINGLAETELINVKVDDIIQAERRFYCRLDAIDKGMYKFFFTHK
jgi:glutamyl-tRNA synthetase